MLLEPGTTYHFKFRSDMDPASPEDGFYRVLQKLTYPEMSDIGDSDYPETYKNRTFLKLQGAVSGDIVFVPLNQTGGTTNYISGYPDANVDAYPRLVLALSLGPVTSEAPLQALKACVLDAVNGYGDWAAEYTLNDIRLVKSGERWAKVSDLDGITTSPTPNPNPYTENRQIKRENAQLRLRVMELETAIRDVFDTSS